MAWSASNPNTFTLSELERGVSHNGVYALQKFLGDIGYLGADPTGFFGSATDEAVKKYQGAKNLVADGVIGPKTSAIIVHSAVVRSPLGSSLPRNLMEGLIAAESSELLGAVNATVPGGLDLGITQRRAYGPPFDPLAVKHALDPIYSVAFSTSNPSKTGIYDRYLVFSSRVGANSYAWRLAALAHNWPSAADTLSKGGTLSKTRLATWCPASVRAEHPWAATWWGWALFYALGSKTYNWGGLTTGRAFGVPTVR